MLYVSSRNNKLTYTAFQALTMPSAADGGIIIPIRLPHYDKTALKAFSSCSFESICAAVFKKFFSSCDNMTGVINCFKEAAPSYSLLDRKTLLVNFGSDTVSKIEEKIYALLLSVNSPMPVMPRCAVRIGLLFGLFSQLKKLGLNHIDVAVSATELYGFLPAVFSKEMGLPLNKIICGSCGEEGLWNYMRKDISFDSVDSNIFTSVVSDRRVDEITSYRQNLSIFAALAYGALQDYRAMTGENVTTIIIN